MPETHAASHEIPVYRRLDLSIVSGEGCLVRDTEGREYVDFYGGHATALLGHGHPRLVDVLCEQARTLFFQTNLVDLPVRRRAAAALAGFAPDGLDHVFFVNSGAEANENALRIACRATGRKVVVALEGAFHGRTAAAGACTAGHERWYGFPATPFDVRVVPWDDAAALTTAVDVDVAAVILEPIQGVAGARDLSADVLLAARAACDDHGAALIADEVQCGMARSGHAFAIEYAGVIPDLITTAKGVAGGFPAGAVIARRELIADIGSGDLGTTFGGGPMACALIEAVVGVIVENDLASRARELEQRIRSRCIVGPVTSIQGRGLLLGLKVTTPASDVLAALRDRGIIAGGASDPDVVRLMPPLVLEDTHVDLLAQALSELGS